MDDPIHNLRNGLTILRVGLQKISEERGTLEARRAIAECQRYLYQLEGQYLAQQLEQQLNVIDANTVFSTD